HDQQDGFREEGGFDQGSGLEDEVDEDEDEDQGLVVPFRPIGHPKCNGARRTVVPFYFPAIVFHDRKASGMPISGRTTGDHPSSLRARSDENGLSCDTKSSAELPIMLKRPRLTARVIHLTPRNTPF